MTRNIEKKDNYFSIPVHEGEVVEIKVGDDDPVVFVAPYHCYLNCYLKSDKPAIQWKK